MIDFRCKICGYVTENGYEYNSHTVKCYNSDLIKNGKMKSTFYLCTFQCEICHLILTDAHEYSSHMANHRSIVAKSDLNFIEQIAKQDVEQLKIKDKEYGSSWKKRGGVGAYMTMIRKFDRMEEQVKKVAYDIFQAAENDSRDEGILDDIRDARRYLLLIEAEIISRRTK